jgi:plasmid segregation protein ParM
MNERVALAIDAGFGMMKFSRKTQGNGVVFDCFPSAAIEVTKTADGGALSSIGADRDVVDVRYDGRDYRVGRDIRHEMIGNDFGKDMTDTYYDSAVYHALMRGALSYMDEPVINTLCLGLPMNHYMAPGRHDKLKKAYEGVIEINQAKSIVIENVVIQPQPFGAYAGLGTKVKELNVILKESGLDLIKNPADLKEMTVLVVDPGEYTLDWLLMTGTGPIMKVSNAIGDAGRHRVIREIHKLIAEKMGRPVGSSFFSDIDLCLRNEKPLRIAGQMFDLQSDEFQSLIMKTIDDPIRQLFEGLRGGDDRIDMAVVMGGSPGDVAKAIKRARPWLPVFCGNQNDGQNSSIFGNLCGFQQWAQVQDSAGGIK